MNDLMKTILIAALLLPSLGLMGCEKETGISNRHVQGIVTLPPIAFWEAEELDRDAWPDLVNDTRQQANGPHSVNYGYHILRGWSDEPCAELDMEGGAPAGQCLGLEAPDLPILPDGDVDYYRIRTSYRGPVVFEARLIDDEPTDAYDIDMEILEANGDSLASSSNTPQPLIDEDGNEVLDDEGLPVTYVPDPRAALPAENGSQFIVAIAVNGPDDGEPVPYEVVIVGNNPNEHFQNRGIEGDAVNYEGDPPEPVIQDPLEIIVGAYLSDDIKNLGNPVGGTSTVAWRLDEDTETFWGAWDMALVQEVNVETNVLLPGMGDGKDNDCNGIADTGTEEVDNDGDGVTIAQGDCNDNDATVHPFRGDEAGDRKDNDCDGWADNGPDDVDNDGDGYCEAGQDVDGDTFCRGRLEQGGFGSGDCNDDNAAIFPLNEEIQQNHIDDDCAGGDQALDESSNTDAGPGDDVEQAQDGFYPDQYEIACGSDPEDTDSIPPADEDADGLCDSDCLGTVDCPQDWDGDGVHNWAEMLCSSDPRDADAGPEDLDGDGVCNGEDGDADGDGVQNQVQGGGTDCNDMDASIHPHIRDELGEVVTWHYDIANGIDDDCDGVVDENRDWILDGDEYVQNTETEARDDDGDGYPLGLRDCDDNDDTMHPGNYEVRSANVASNDFNTVWLFAGAVTSLNSTRADDDARRTPDVLPFDLAKDRVAWNLVPDWELNSPPHLLAEGLPVLEASFAKQPKVGRTWFETTEDNDQVMAGFSVEEPAPWVSHPFQELGEAADAGRTNVLYGEIEDIVADTWGGDNDSYHVTFPQAGVLRARLDWDTGGGDYDSIFYCYYFDAINAPRHYRIPFRSDDPAVGTNALVGFSKPEEGETTVPLPDGSDCWFFVVGYSGSPGPYNIALTPAGNGDDGEEDE